MAVICHFRSRLIRCNKINWLPLAQNNHHLLNVFFLRFRRFCSGSATAWKKIWSETNLGSLLQIGSHLDFFPSCSPNASLEVKEKIIGNDVWSSIFLLCDNPTFLVILTVQHQFLSWRKRKKKNRNKCCFRPGSNRGPCACEAHVITTTLRKLRY